jgi:hypothetical protein
MAQAHVANSTPEARKPKKDWTPDVNEQARIDAMLAKCKKHSNPNQAEPAPSDAGTVAPTPRGSLPNSLGASQLIWNRTSTHEMTSGCTRYKVTKETIEHVLTEQGKLSATHVWRYQPWARVQWLWYTHLGPLVEDFSQAQAVCEAHFRTLAP